MLESEAEAINGRRLTFGMRKEEVLPTAGPHAKCKFNLLTDLAGKPRRVAFEEARCGILVHPQEMKDGRVKMECEPQIQHGEPGAVRPLERWHGVCDVSGGTARSLPGTQFFYISGAQSSTSSLAGKPISPTHLARLFFAWKRIARCGSGSWSSARARELECRV